MLPHLIILPHLLSVLATGSLATNVPPHWGSMRVKHAWNAVPENWVCLGHPPAETSIDLHIALKSQREDALTDALYEVSTPEHPKYGKHLSKDQVAELVAPHSDTLEFVGSWLEHHDMPSSRVSLTHGGSWLTVSGVPVSRANDLLAASFQLYRHTMVNTTVLRTISYGLPAELHVHVHTVVPTTYFGVPYAPWLTTQIFNESRAEAPAEEAPRGPAAKLSSRDDEFVTPAVLRSLYRTTAYVPAVPGRNKFGIVGLNNEYPNPVDLAMFMNEYRIDGADATYRVVPVNDGGYDFNDPGLEATTNVQYAAAITYPTPLTFYSTGGTYIRDDPLLKLLNYLLMQPVIPQTISISYGTYEHRIPIDLAGDDGVGVGDCRDADGNVNFIPTFPATCPFVTSVGGTVDDDPEVGAHLSGGGFSNYFAREPYQNDAVTNFLSDLGGQYEGMFNPAGRAIPDVSAQAFGYKIIFKRQQETYLGTSCATPTVAGVISLLNDYQISQGRDPLGWLNPWLYGTGRRGFNDITSGMNPGCGTDGFSAIVGWDPVTGLGTPDFIRLQGLVPGASSGAGPSAGPSNTD